MASWAMSRSVAFMLGVFDVLMSVNEVRSALLFYFHCSSMLGVSLVIGYRAECTPLQGLSHRAEFQPAASATMFG